MNELPKLVKDPVCEMLVEQGGSEAVHEGISYSFCSLQCRERFIARPGLYVGERRRPAPKQRGVKLMRQRRIRLHQVLTQDRATALVAALREMMGVVEVRYIGSQVNDERAYMGVGEVEISYDLLEATIVQLEGRIAALGVQLGFRIEEKLCRDFINYFEQCELEDVERETTARGLRKLRRDSLQALR